MRTSVLVPLSQRTVREARWYFCQLVCSSIRIVQQALNETTEEENRRSTASVHERCIPVLCLKGRQLYFLIKSADQTLTRMEISYEVETTIGDIDICLHNLELAIFGVEV